VNTTHLVDVICLDAADCRPCSINERLHTCKLNLNLACNTHGGTHTHTQSRESINNPLSTHTQTDCGAGEAALCYPSAVNELAVQQCWSLCKGVDSMHPPLMR
jgi:hypothetical protein